MKMPWRIVCLHFPSIQNALSQAFKLMLPKLTVEHQLESFFQTILQKGNAHLALDQFDEAKECYESLRTLGQNSSAEQFLKKLNDAQDRDQYNKLGCVVRMVVDSVLPHADCGPNDNRKDAPPFIVLSHNL